MRFLRRYNVALSFVGLLVLCSLMVLRQFHLNQARHCQIREAFILLHAKGYDRESQCLFRHLVESLPGLNNAALYDDYQRTAMLVDCNRYQPANLVWRYHVTVTRELQSRFDQNLERALKLAQRY